MTITVVDVVQVTVQLVPKRVDGPGSDGDDCRFVRRTSGFLVRWTWVVVVTVPCGGTTGSLVEVGR